MAGTSLQCMQGVCWSPRSRQCGLAFLLCLSRTVTQLRLLVTLCWPVDVAHMLPVCRAFAMHHQQMIWTGSNVKQWCIHAKAAVGDRQSRQDYCGMFNVLKRELSMVSCSCRVSATRVLFTGCSSCGALIA